MLVQVRIPPNVQHSSLHLLDPRLPILGAENPPAGSRRKQRKERGGACALYLSDFSQGGGTGFRRWRLLKCGVGKKGLTSKGEKFGKEGRWVDVCGEEVVEIPSLCREKGVSQSARLSIYTAADILDLHDDHRSGLI